jgi:uncharacterized protein (DUF58 family)
LAKDLDSGILAYVDIDTKEGPIQFRKRWVLVLLGILLVLQVFVPSRTWVILLVGLGGTIGLSYLWVREMARQLAIVREQHYGWVHVGDLLEEHFHLQNGSFLPALWVEINDQSDLPGYSANTVRSVDGLQSVEWRTEGICRQRGLFTLGPWQARTSDPFGFFDIVLTFSQTQSILIYPPVVHLPTIGLPKGAATGSARTSQRALELTTNAAGVRTYAPGDSLSRVHWRSTARHHSLMVKNFDLEPSGDLWIILDMDASVQAGEGEESTEEYGVILASSLADRVLRQNRSVGLAAYGIKGPAGAAERTPLPTIVLPQKGKAQQWRILQALATVRAGGHWPLDRVLAEMDQNLGRGTTLAVITPSCDTAWVAGLLPPMRRGVTPTVVLIDAQTFGQRTTGMNSLNWRVEEMAAMLANLGVTSHRIVQGMPFRPIVEPERIGRPEFRVLRGTGRVIPIER